MRDTLVQARTGLADMSAAIDKTREQLAAEQSELDTVRRRRAMAEQIGDRETVAVANRFESRHTQRVEVLARKLAAQEEELSLAEAEVSAMTSELKAAAKGIGSASDATDAAAAEAEALLDEAGRLQSEIDSLARRRSRAAKEAAAEERLAELKRRMEK